MKALSVRQPWAQLLLRDTDRKTIENRTWTTDYRGPLAIHASKAWDRSEYEAAWRLCVEQGYKPPPGKSECQRGRILGVMRLEDVLHADDVPVTGQVNPWHVVDQYAWLMEEPRRLGCPVRASGQLGLWDVPLHKAERIAYQLHGTRRNPSLAIIR